MNQSNDRNNYGGNVEESGNNQADSNGKQAVNDFGEAAAVGTLNGAVTGAMIGAQFGLIGTVIGGISGGAIGNQMVEGTEDNDRPASQNHDQSNDSSINK